MLERIDIRGFKSLLKVEAQLAPLVVLLGPNAVGKSNFLEALFLLSRLVTERTLTDAFKPPFRGYPVEAFHLPDQGLPGLLAQASAELAVEADIGSHPSSQPPRPRRLRYRAKVRIRPQTGSLETREEYLVRLTSNSTPSPNPRIERLGQSLLVRQLGRAGRPSKEPLGLSHTLASNRQYSGEKRYPDFDQLREELSAWRTYYLDPRVAMRESQPPTEAVDIGPRGEAIAPFLYRLKAEHPRQFKALYRVLHSAIPTIEALDVDLDPKRGTLDIQIQQEGTWHTSRVLSEGTLRVLALSAIAANPWPSHLVAFEEPENGVHPRRIEVIADLLVSMAHKRQVLVTTHSPTLLAKMVDRRNQSPKLVSLLRCIQDGSATRVEPFDPMPLHQDDEIRQALAEPQDRDLMQVMLLRGWLDG